MTIKELRLLPPLAFARFGSASEPQDNYTLEDNKDDPLGFRKIVPADTLIVAPDGTVSVRPADRAERTLADFNKMFRDGERIRPVAPFFELFAVTGDHHGKLEQVTLEQLKKEGIELGAVEWRVCVENRKVFRRTGDKNDIVSATTGWFSNHDPQPLIGTCPHFAEGKSISFGFVQYVKPNSSNPICSQLRLRFTPAHGKIYGPFRDGVPDPPYVMPTYEKGDWTNFSEKLPGTPKTPGSSESWPRETLPVSLYAIEPPAPSWLNNNRAKSRGYLDDACDGFIEVRISGSRPFHAKARICAGPPDFVLDSRFVRTLADDLDQVVNGPDAHDLDVAEARKRSLDIVRRAYETVRFLNVAVMNGNLVNGRLAAEFDTMPAEESFATERPIRPVMSPDSVDTAAILTLHQQVFTALNAGATPWFPRLLRKPEEVGDLTDRGRRKMPALMSGADSFYLSLTHRQIATVDKAANSGVFEPPTERRATPKPEPALSPRNLTAQLFYEAAGNPINSRPGMAVANCCPGLEVDFRAVWRRLFEGIELSEHENYVVDDQRVHADGRKVKPDLKDRRLLKVGGGKDGKLSSGKEVTVTLYVPAASNPNNKIKALSETNPDASWTMEWSNCLAHVVDLLRKGVTEIECEFSGPVTATLKVRSFFEAGSAVVSTALAEAGELTQGLCSPWQNDLRECSCYYWASSRPDFVNMRIGEDGLTHGDNWMAKVRTAEYVPDDYLDSRLISYEDLFENWERLRFQIGGKDSDPPPTRSGASRRSSKP